MIVSWIFFAAHLFVPVGPTKIASPEEIHLKKPSYEHVLTSKNMMLDTLELEDHSKWSIAAPDVYKTVGWEIHDQLVLIPHTSRFSIYKFPFSIVNMTRESQVRVNFTSHPCDYKTGNQWVVSTDKFSHRLFLSDGSSWNVNPRDAEFLKNWEVNDFIIYGKNEGKYPFFLINIRLNHGIGAIEF